MTSDSASNSASNSAVVPGHYLPPALTGWQQTWRWGLCLIGSLALFMSQTGTANHSPGWLDLAGGGVAFILVGFRRRHPFLICVVLGAIAAFSLSAVTAATWAAISLCTRRRWREIVPATVLALAFSLAGTAWSGELLGALRPPFAGMSRLQYVSYLGFVGGGVLAMTASGIALGMYIGARRDLIASLSERASTAEREQRIRVLAAQAQERNRIAREMHDALAHQLTLVSMHAGALASRDDLTGEQTRRTAGIIQQGAGRALAELRGILGSLRNTEEVDGRLARPQPTLADLAGLIDAVRAAGMRIELDEDLPDADELPVPTSRNLYRIIAECLTNAGKHAPGATVHVTLSGGRGEGVRLRVSNAVRGADARGVPGSGSGLIGVEERVEALGGRIGHGIEDGRFVVEVWLPW
ncbi:sensor histidine kinase [Acidipropionibacterium virtanenii]|uniref:sensor histidine kinase n=1 Tax=Acidipropionibacterium virtanenii TaxID=2057246 RepID=UPI0011BFD05F|nr:histidine kinase [Acidipropionibacterium virtanenii]